MSTEVMTQKRPFAMVATVVILLVSFILILIDVEACLNIAYTFMALASVTKATAGAVGTALTLFLGIGALAFTVCSLEYHVKHAGEPRSRRLLGISLGIQVALALVGMVIF